MNITSTCKKVWSRFYGNILLQKKYSEFRSPPTILTKLSNKNYSILVESRTKFKLDNLKFA